MRNGFLFSTARAAALVSLLWTPLWGISPGPAARAAPAPSGADVTDGGSLADPYDFLRDFWQLAWGLEFVPGDSGLLLGEQLAEDVWLLEVTAETGDPPVVAEGLYVEAGREHLDYLAWTPQQLQQAGLTSVDHSLTAGTVYGSTGFSSPVVALLIEFLLVPEDGTGDPVSGGVLTPGALAVDIDAALLEMAILASLEDAGPDTYVGTAPLVLPQVANPFQLQTSDEGGDDTSSCELLHEMCVSQCKLVFHGVAWGAGFGGAIACLFGCGMKCSVTGGLAGVCFAVCSAACIIAEAAVLYTAMYSRKACLIGCQADRIQCDPSWTPPPEPDEPPFDPPK